MSNRKKSKKNFKSKDSDEINNDVVKIKNENKSTEKEENLRDKTSVLEKDEISNLIEEDLRPKKKNMRMKKHILVNIFLIILISVSLAFLGVNICDRNTSAISLVGNLLLALFTILFAVICITSNKKNKSTMLISSLLLLSYFGLELSKSFNVIGDAEIEDFSGKTITYVMQWAEKNNVTVNQEYEYSDMVNEYKVISQNTKSADKIEKTKEITVSVSEGPNPSKEIIVPNMITWDTERVLEFVKNNYLSNVSVEFVESEKAQDTVIEQNTSGTLKRDDELKLTFSYGEELGYEEVALIDLTGKSKFEVDFYMKQHHLKYEFNYDFSNKQKRYFAMKQSVKPGKKVKINDEVITVTISMGPKIKVPDFKGMSMTEVTEWAIKNKVKLEFSDKYDDSVKENDVISSNYDKGKIIEQGTVVKIILSRGKLTMPKFKSFNEFREWADKYGIKYEESHEFNDSVETGEVISYSYKKGDTIKNGDTIIVKISDGKKREVPNLKGLTKNEAIAKLEKADLKYNFVYSSSNDVAKDKVISQSISSGSEVSSGTTITVTLSSGKKEATSNKGSSSSSSSSKPSNSGSSNSGGSGNSGTTTPTCDRTQTTKVYIYDELISNVPETTCSKIKTAYSNVHFVCSYVTNPNLNNGQLSNSGSIDEKTFNHCDTYTLSIVKN